MQLDRKIIENEIRNKVACKKEAIVAEIKANNRKKKESQESEIRKLQFGDFDLMDGHEFEFFCAKVLKHCGYTNVFVTRGSGDHGIDVIAEKEGKTFAIQCKCYKELVGNRAIQEAYSGKDIYEKDYAVVMTNSYFTKQAKEDADRLGVVLWNRDSLKKMLDKISPERYLYSGLQQLPDDISLSLQALDERYNIVEDVYIENGEIYNVVWSGNPHAERIDDIEAICLKYKKLRVVSLFILLMASVLTVLVWPVLAIDVLLIIVYRKISKKLKGYSIAAIWSETYKELCQEYNENEAI